VRGLPEGECLDIHSKVMIVDDEWVRIGSANLAERSMGVDTECDVVVEAKGDARATQAIRHFCHSLIAEHVAAEPEAVAVPGGKRRQPGSGDCADGSSTATWSS
jgi:hypothetical protein